jgi:hypothetical protein
MSTVSCGGQRGVSDTFASALWAVDALFQMARVGVDGVNIHTRPGSANALFSFRYMNGSWKADVHPEYYGLMMFARAAPAGARLLRISGPRNAAVRVWATRSPDKRIRVVLINKDPTSPTVVTVRAPVAHGPGALSFLLAPSIGAPGGVTLGGQSFGVATATGRLSGASPRQLLQPNAENYTVRLPAACAAMLTLPAS